MTCKPRIALRLGVWHHARRVLGRVSYLVRTPNRIPILRSMVSRGPREGIPANVGARMNFRTSGHRGAILGFAAALCAGALGVGNQVLGQGFAELRPTWQEQSLSGKEFDVPVDDALAAEIDTLIPRLGVAGYKARDAATQRLVEIGPAAFGQLRRAYRESDEFEVRLRIEEIVREAYLTHHVYNVNGFLGISQDRNPRTPDLDPRVPQGRIGILIRRIIEDTAAQRVGLQADDVIIALDGEPLGGTGSRAILELGEALRARGAGATVKLTVLRAAETLQFEAVLGPRPKIYYVGNQTIVVQMLTAFRKNFPTWWTKYFHPSPTPRAKSDEN